MVQGCQATVSSREKLSIDRNAFLRVLSRQVTRGCGSPHRVARGTGIDVTRVGFKPRNLLRLALY